VSTMLERRQEELVAAMERRMAEIESAVRERIENLAGIVGGSPRD
jgi:predicted ArsR family transcriptional regulator